MTIQPSTGGPSLGRRSLLLGGLAAVASAGPAGSAYATSDRRPGGHHHKHHHHKHHHNPSSTRLTLGARGVLQLGGVAFATGGVNAFQLITNDYPSPRLMGSTEIDSLFASAAMLNARVVRAHTLGASVGHKNTLVTGVSGIGPSPRIEYDQAVWDVIDYAVWQAHERGLYLIAPFVDEWGYYHGGKRNWVNFRHPGTVSLDPGVTSGNSAEQRRAEDLFYTDQQVTWDFDQYVRDWLQHVNPHTGLAHKDEPALSIVQVGNELWTAAQDAPGWVAAKAALVKSVAPTTLVMDSGADGLAVKDMAWGSPDVDILETHPYTSFGAADVTQMAAFAAAHGKAFAVGEYPWSKASAPAIEAAARHAPNIFTSAPWSLQNPGDLHNQGAPLGSDDVSLYVPATTAAGQDAVARIAAQGSALTGRDAQSTSGSRHRRHRRRHRRHHRAHRGDA